MFLAAVGVTLMLGQHELLRGAREAAPRVAMVTGQEVADRGPGPAAGDAEEMFGEPLKHGEGRLLEAKGARPATEAAERPERHKAASAEPREQMHMAVRAVGQAGRQGAAGAGVRSWQSVAQAPAAPGAEATRSQRPAEEALGEQDWLGRPGVRTPGGPPLEGTQFAGETQAHDAAAAPGREMAAAEALPEEGEQLHPPAGSGRVLLRLEQDLDVRGARRQRRVFRQVAVEGEQQWEAEGEPDQILVVEVPEPLELAGKAIELANANGIGEITLSLPVGDEAEGVEVELAVRVPAEQYEEFLWQVSRQVWPPHNQRLSTTPAATADAYLQEVARHYNYAARGVSADTHWGFAKEAGERGFERGAFGGLGEAREAPEGTPPSAAARLDEIHAQARAARQAAAERAETRRRAVNLLIRVVRRAADVGRAAAPATAADADEAQ